MNLKKKAVTGMKDILPSEMAIRSYVMGLIRACYARYGFVQMETPCVEHIENLNSKQGGENEKLIFKILKRGEKLKLDSAKDELDLVDGGLRYDLTVPLCRYYAEHQAELPAPFKALQMGNVWRADRPQRGRYRQFMQCDIDVLGEASYLAEVELILATSEVIGQLPFEDFTIRINDRRILKAMAKHCGFSEESYDEVFITLDKMDKIGEEGVKEELVARGHKAEQAEQYLELFSGITHDVEGVRALQGALGDDLDDKVAAELALIISQVDAAKTANFRLLFDPTLVRGMSYYTGPIFEISLDGFAGSVGGGGRYDEMIGKFTGQSVPACGFSIGFERIVMLLLEQGFAVPDQLKKKAYLLDKRLSDEQLGAVYQRVKEERAKGMAINLLIMKKNKKFQKQQLEEEGYTEIEEVFAD